VEISTRKDGDVLVADCAGSLDTQTSGQATEAMNRIAVEAGGKLLVNLSKLDFLSSAGLRVFLRVAKSMDAAGGAMKVCEPRGVVQEVLDISGFASLVEVHADEAAALAAF
jgi:anti-sigma B factor antagonist